jgi:hypothetical protein
MEIEMPADAAHTTRRSLFGVAALAALPAVASRGSLQERWAALAEVHTAFESASGQSDAEIDAFTDWWNSARIDLLQAPIRSKADALAKLDAAVWMTELDFSETDAKAVTQAAAWLRAH